MSLYSELFRSVYCALPLFHARFNSEVLLINRGIVCTVLAAAFCTQTLSFVQARRPVTRTVLRSPRARSALNKLKLIPLA